MGASRALLEPDTETDTEPTSGARRRACVWRLLLGDARGDRPRRGYRLHDIDACVHEIGDVNRLDSHDGRHQLEAAAESVTESVPKATGRSGIERLLRAVVRGDRPLRGE